MTVPAARPWWTVIGLYDSDSDEFLLAGVLAGRHTTVDDDLSACALYVPYQRMAHHVQAGSWQRAAEEVAGRVTQVEASDADPTATGDGHADH